MAMMRDDSGRGKKTYPVGSPEWLREQKVLADQRNRQNMLEQQKREAAEKRLFQQEEIPLPSGDTATRNPVDAKPVTYTPGIENFERDELRKTKEVAIEKKRKQQYVSDRKKALYNDKTLKDVLQLERDELGNIKERAINNINKDISALPKKSPTTAYPNYTDYIISALTQASSYIVEDDLKMTINGAINTIQKEKALIDDPDRDYSQYISLYRGLTSSQNNTSISAIISVANENEALMHYDSSIASIFLTACSFFPGPGGALCTIINSAMNADNFKDFAESAGGGLIPGPMGDLYSVYDCAQTIKKNKLNPIVVPGDKMITITLENDRDVTGYTFLVDKDMNIKEGPETWVTTIPHSGWDSYEKSHPKSPMELNIENYTISYDFE